MALLFGLMSALEKNSRFMTVFMETVCVAKILTRKNQLEMLVYDYLAI